MTQEDEMNQVFENLQPIDLDSFHKTPSGRLYSDALKFKDDASRDLVEEHKDYRSKGRVARITKPEAAYLAQLLAKQHEAKRRLGLWSLDTAVEAYPANRETEDGKNYWTWNKEDVYQLDGVWIVPNSAVVPYEGRLEFDINGNSGVKIVRGKRVEEGASVDGGIKVEADNLYDALKQAKLLRDHKVKTTGGEIYFKDTNYPNIASVRSDSIEWVFDAVACRPSVEDDVGGLRLELRKKES